ncbi:MAG: glycosyltransferase [Myxococcota bacterium]
MPLFYIISGIALIVWILSFIRGIRELRRNPHLNIVSKSEYSQKISIIVPARNEEERILPLLESIASQSYQNFELIVVDDKSEDRTVDVVNSYRGKIKNLKIVESDAQQGWCGKNAALVKGFQNVDKDSEWLLFIDADCELRENALLTVLDFALRNSIDCLSLFPEVRSERFFERLLLPSVGAMVTLFNSPEKVNNPSDRVAFLNGQFIFVKKDVYRDIGTHESVKDAILEDAALAYEVKMKGYKIFLGFGENIYLVRMYNSFSEFINGWTKNLYLIIGGRISALIKMVSINILLSYLPVIWLFAGLFYFQHPLSILFILGYLTVLFFQMYLRYSSGTHPLYAILAPFSSTIVSFVAIRSAYRHIYKKGVDWKGRRYFSNR